MAEVKRLLADGGDERNQLILVDIDWEELDPHTLSHILKVFLRELPEPIFPFSFFERLVDIRNIRNPTFQLSALFDIVNNLPTINKTILKEFSSLCYEITLNKNVTKMDAKSLTVILGPLLVRPKRLSEDPTFTVSNDILCLLIDNHTKLFPEVNFFLLSSSYPNK